MMQQATLVQCLFALIAMHFFCDFPLQGGFLALHKDPWMHWLKHTVTGQRPIPWFWAMAAHCAIQAAGVWIISRSAILAGWEFVAHFLIDTLKCYLQHREELEPTGVSASTLFSVDQCLHIVCKCAWIGLGVWSFA